MFLSTTLANVIGKYKRFIRLKRIMPRDDNNFPFRCERL